MSFSKSIIITILTILLAGATWLDPQPAKAAGEVIKIGIFDLQRAINNSTKGKAAKNKLTSQYERMQKELKSRETELERLQKEIESQSSMLSPEAKYEKEKVLQRKVRDFQDKYRDYTEEMKKEELQNTQPLVNDILVTASKIGKEKGYTLILEAAKAGVIYAPDALDITDEVIKRFDTGK